MSQVTSAEIVSVDGTPIYPSLCTAAQWDEMKNYSAAHPHAYKMACCGARAVLKTSLYGVQFAAHASNECATEPETVWHITAKDAILGALTRLGLPALHEATGGAGRDRWRADVLTETQNKQIVFEIQRSYQHFRDFERRQKRYNAVGVDCYWVLRGEVAQPLIKSITRKRLREEFGNRLPEGSFFPILPSLHFAIYLPEDERAIVSPSLPRLTVPEWVAAIVGGKIHYDPQIDRGRWMLRP